jgi:hypothetical protein
MSIKKVHPALKHGGYAATALLPGEDPVAFEKLHRDLIAELVPNGALEDDIVATIAHLVWRKQNLSTFRIAELARNRCARLRSEKLPPAYDIDPDAKEATRAADEKPAKSSGTSMRWSKWAIRRQSTACSMIWKSKTDSKPGLRSASNDCWY